MEYIFLVIVALVAGVFAVRRILRTMMSPVLKIVSVCATVVGLAAALLVGFLILYYAGGGH
jgi:hypothetical protein